MKAVYVCVTIIVLSCAGWATSADQPAYAGAYDRVLEREQQGDVVGALRAIPAVYEEDIPVDAFYRTLGEKRSGLLAALAEDDEVAFGRERYRIRDLRQYFAQVMAGRSETFTLNPPPSKPYPVDRFLYLLIAAGTEHARGPGLLMMYAAPDIDPAEALQSMDPWLVSGAIFFARKAMPESVTAQQVIDRWEARPDLWDEICRQEALLFLATQPGKVVEKLEIERDNVRDAIDSVLESGDSGEAALRPVFVMAHTGEEMKHPPSSIELYRMERVDGELKGVDQKTIKVSEFKDGWISVEPGYYKIKHNSVSGSPPSGYYGESEVVEIKQGQKADVRVRLTPAS